MISKRTIFEIHRLHDQRFSMRSIARQLRISRESVAKFLKEPNPVVCKGHPRASKLDPFADMIREMVEECPDIKAPVVLQRIRDKGFDGEITIVRNRLRTLRGRAKRRQPFIRFESQPGEQVQIDWGYFGYLSYGETKRRLYGLVVVEGYSRMLSVYFCHSQQQESLHQGLLEAFTHFNGVPREIVVDNMLTAVTERVGAMVRFNEAFLDFLRNFSITPRACTVRAPHEKGKVENAIKYIRSNFLPLRTFADLADAQNQMNNWLADTANVRKHQTTGQRPVDRMQGLQPLPNLLPDCRQFVTSLVHKDFGVRFDANVYTVPPWAIGKHVMLKADRTRIWIFYKDRMIACHTRCWDKKQRIELELHRQQVKKLKKKLLQDRQVLLFLSLGEPALRYLKSLTEAGQPIRKNIRELLRLQDEYGDRAVLDGLKKGLAQKLYGADYIRNILYQQMTPVKNNLPVPLKQRELSEIRLTTPVLADYDAIAMKKRYRHD
jgi:transposase